jgi:hypothetical protein
MNARIFSRTALAVALSTMASAALAHHGFGLFQMSIDKEWSGTLTKVDLVNPHSYMYFDAVDADGKVQSMRCEMRAATLLRRMGWSPDMFTAGAHVEVKGHPHRDDPGACFLEEFALNDAVELNRYQQLSDDAPADATNRPERLASGEPNISGDWAQEQTILTDPPSGGEAIRVPRSLIPAFTKGEVSVAEIRALSPARPAPVYTPAGRAAADAFENWNPEQNPRLRCEPTSIIFDWTFDWPVNRLTQTEINGEKVIDIDYGIYGLSRRIHMDMDSHPENLTPDRQGHSIGRWQDDKLVVDTVGFEAGVLVVPTLNSEQMHVVEIFTVGKDSITGNLQLTREFNVMDPVYLAAPYHGVDVMLLSSVPFESHPCQELTPEFIDQQP